MTATRRVPGRRLGHRSWRDDLWMNSHLGATWCKRSGKNWTDNDGHLSAPDADGRCAWCNGHGVPSTAWIAKGDRYENHTWAELSKMHRRYQGHSLSIRTVRQTFEDNHRAGLGTEWEVKNVHPWDTEEILDDAMQRFASHAEEVYGPTWRQHVNLKVLTTWGLPYALRICRAAHKHGIPTLLSVRGKHRYSFTGDPSVTYVRGSLRRFK